MDRPPDNGRYALERPIGAGAFGVVWAARDRRRRIPVALKILHKAPPGVIAAVKRTFRRLAALSHPHLVELYDLTYEPALGWCLAMELIDGEALAVGLGAPATVTADDTMAAPMPSRRSLAPAEAEAIARQLLDGLGALHAAGIAHGDLKPDNVMLARDGRVVLVDVDLAAGRHIAATPAWTAPELRHGGPRTTAGDLWAAGKLLDGLAAFAPGLAPRARELGASDPAHRAPLVPPSVAPRAAPVPPLIVEALTRAQSSPRLVIVEAEPGSGKSALLEALATSSALADDGWTVLHRGYAERDATPLGLFDELLAASEDDALLPLQRELLAPSEARRDHALRALIEARGRVVVLVDDLPRTWIAATLAILQARAEVVVVCTRRPDGEARGALESALARMAVEVTHVTLPPRTQRAAALPPLSLVARGALDVLLAAGAPLPDGVVLAVLGARMDETISPLLRAGLIRRTPYGVALSSDALGASTADARMLALRQRLVRELTDPSVEPEPDDLALAARLWIALGEPDRAVPLLARAGRLAAAQGHCELAARQLRAALTAMPKDQGVVGSPLAQRLWSELATALGAAGRGVDAADAWRMATFGRDRALARVARRHQAEELLLAGRVGAGVSTLEHALAERGLKLERYPIAVTLGIGMRRALGRLRHALGPTRDPSAGGGDAELVDLLFTGAFGLALVDGVAAASMQARHMLAALDLHEPRRLARALALDLGFISANGIAARARISKLERELTRRLAALDDPELAALTTALRGQAAFMLGELARADALLDDAEAALLALRTGASATALVHVRVFRVWTRMLRGRIQSLRSASERLGFETRTSGSAILGEALAVEGTTLYLIAAGRLDDARAAAAGRDAPFQRPALPPLPRFNAWEAEVHVALAERRVADAEALCTHIAGFAADHMLDVVLLRNLTTCLRGRVALAAHDRAAAERAAGTLARARDPYAPAFGLLIEAGLACLGGASRDAARAAYSRAEVALAATDFGLYHAGALAHLARLGDDEAGARLAAWRAREGIADAAGLVRFTTGLAPEDL